MIETPQILLVEHEQSTIDQVTLLIEKIGFTKPRIAVSIEEARKLVDENRPDLALVDFSFDNIKDGHNTARMLQDEYNLPVVYLAARDEGMPDEGNSSPYGYVFKPVDHRSLKKTILLALSRHSLLDNFASLITDSTTPAVLIDIVSSEVMVGNQAFLAKFPDIKKHDRLNDLKNINAPAVDVINHIVNRANRERNPFITKTAMHMADGVKTFNIFTRLIESMGEKAVSLTFVEMDESLEETFLYSPLMQLRMDLKGTILEANKLWLERTGYTELDVIGKPLSSFFPECSARCINDEILTELQTADTLNLGTLELELQNGDNACFQANLSFLPQSLTVLAVFIDMSNIPAYTKEKEEIALANALRDSAAALTSTLNFDEVLDQILVNVGEVVPNEAANVMMIWSGVAYIVRSIGYAELGIEETMMGLQIPITQESHFLSMYTTGMPLAVGDTHKYAALESHSSIDWARSMASAPLRSKGQVFGFLNLESSQPDFYDQIHADRLQAFADQAAVAIENARLYAEVQQYAITDELTGIYNRRGLFELGRREVERAHRYGRSLSAVMIDTDKFKDINDTYSHAVGDHVLRAMANIWKANIREVDILGRYGGDEFVILLPETDLENALPVADRLRLAICGTPIETPVADIPVSVSVGVAVLTKEIETFDTLMEVADAAMFRSKNGGRNQVNK